MKVAPDGDDALAESSLGATPFRNVQPAIDFANSHREVGTRVCVAVGPSCAETASFSGPASADLRMRDGISVYGGYESSGFTRCEPLAETTLAPTTAVGVVFESDVQTETTLDGVTIEPFAAATTAGVTLRGASNVRLSDVAITDEGAVNWYGVDLIGADATMSSLAIDVAQTTGESIGVRSVDSHVVLVGTIELGTTSGSAYGVWLEESPGSELDVDITVNIGSGGMAGGALRITGDAEDVEVTDSILRVIGQSADTVGVFMDECAGAAPLLARTTIAVDGRAATNPIEAIRSVGDCHPRIEQDLVSAVGANAQTTIGIHCAPGTSEPSRCVVVDSDVRTSNSRAMPGPAVFGTGILCGTESCASIRENTIVGLDVVSAGCFRSCSYDAVGVDLTSTNTLVTGNVIRAGCGDRSAGIRASGSPTNGPARIENNIVFGRTTSGECGAVSDGVFTSAAIVSGGDLDVHSNTLDAGGSTNAANPCHSAAVAGGRGEYRNNILLAGICNNRYGFSNTTLTFYDQPASGFPSALANNDFDPTNVTALYLRDAMTLVTTIDGVNALPLASANISAPPQFIAYPTDLHLAQGSPCVGAGTTALAPLVDIDGDTRDDHPDVGADER